MTIEPNSGYQPPAGWYPDPSDPTLQRWWDGAAWTEHTAPGQPPALTPQQFAAASPAPAPAPGRSSRGLVIALVAVGVGLLAVSGIAWAVLGGTRDDADVAAATSSPSATAATPATSPTPDVADTTGAPADPASRTVLTAAESHELTIPEGWERSAQEDLMAGVFGDLGDLGEFVGMWTLADSFEADQLLVLSLHVPASQEVLSGGFTGATTNMEGQGGTVTAHDPVWTTTDDGRMLAYQTVDAEFQGVASTTTLVQVEAGDWTVQVTVTSASGEDTEASALAVARSVVPAT